MGWRIPNPFRRKNKLQEELERKLREAEARERKTGEDLVAASLMVQEKHLELDRVGRDYHEQLELNSFLMERFERYNNEVALAKRLGRRPIQEELDRLHNPTLSCVSGLLPSFDDRDLSDYPGFRPGYDGGL